MANTGDGRRGRGAVRLKTLLNSESLYQYILDTTVFPREPDCLRELRHVTEQHPKAFMAAAPDGTQLLVMLLRMLDAKKTVEVGVFTGYSLLATALAIPDDGKIVAIDVDRESYELGLPVIEKAGVAHKIDFREGLAVSILDQLLAEEENKGQFDFAFVDADKFNLLNYHERVLELVRVGGLIVYDNTLRGGWVALPPDAPLSERNRTVAELVKEFNATVAADMRVEVSQLSVADGVTLCRRIA